MFLFVCDTQTYLTVSTTQIDDKPWRSWLCSEESHSLGRTGKWVEKWWLHSSLHEVCITELALPLLVVGISIFGLSDGYFCQAQTSSSCSPCWMSILNMCILFFKQFLCKRLFVQNILLDISLWAICYFLSKLLFSRFIFLF